MRNSITYPIKLTSKLKDYIWGGVKLKDEWGKDSILERVAESWEFSAFPKMESLIDGGKYHNLTILELKELLPDVLGDKVDEFILFPLLIKLIDAKNDLSIQVHPSDEYALIHEKELGKIEAWYIADAESDGAIYYGFNKDVTEEEIREGINNHTICQLLNRVNVKKGDYFYVPAGTVHAILNGVTILEIQESSNLTYRFYDYGRKDSFGKERELHIEKALKVVNKKASAAASVPRDYKEFDGYKVRRLSDTKYFKTKEVIISKEYPLYNANTFITLTVIDGEGKFNNDFPLKKGDTFLIAADLKVSILSDNMTIIETTL